MRNMDGRFQKTSKIHGGDESELRRGPWTLEEDTILIHYIASHGEGRWNMLARCSGLKRTGKSCRLRWLNYLKPDVKRGNLTPEEQLLILELHSKWGNRWSRIAQHLPGRTDNEIKNYWRTRVQKQARQLQCDANSQRFRETIRCFWMPRLLQKISTPSTNGSSATTSSPQIMETPQPSSSSSLTVCAREEANNKATTVNFSGYSQETNQGNFSSDSQLPTVSEFQTSPQSPLSRGCYFNDCYDPMNTMAAPTWNDAVTDCPLGESTWFDEYMLDGLWNMDEFMYATQYQNGI